MPAATLSKTIKLRVKPEWKRLLSDHARSENLRTSDIVRRAIHEFIERRKRRK